ncbi:hypothetical protein L7F22_038168 [Adiantum nelumboides]|nr:hypothetical protein [Adiantum nelumboides]
MAGNRDKNFEEGSSSHDTERVSQYEDALFKAQLVSFMETFQQLAKQPKMRELLQGTTHIVSSLPSEKENSRAKGSHNTRGMAPMKDGDAVMDALEQLRQAGWAKLWNSQPYVSRRTTFVRELTTLGIKNAEKLGIPSVRDDAAFLWTVVGVTSVLAVLAGQLPGDWGFFVPYLIGSISLVVLGIGSIAPGVLQAAIVSFSSVFEDYQDRVLRHEAAHFLVAYLLGVPIVGYSLDIGKEHVNLVDKKIQKRIYEGKIDSKVLDKLAVVAMAGLAAEGLKYDKVTGQLADLFSLQRLIN